MAIDYQGTLKILIRAKLAAQMREDMALLMCRYLDVMEELRQLQILREERASDNLISDLAEKMVRNARALKFKIRQFIAEYPKLFKASPTKVIWIGRSDISQEVDAILEELEPHVEKSN